MTVNPDDMALCWAGDLTRAGALDPWFDECDQPHAYEIWLNPDGWDRRYTILCPEHTAKIRALPDGNIIRIATTSAGQAG